MLTVAAIPPGSYIGRRLVEKRAAETVFLHMPRESLTATPNTSPNIPIVLGDRDRDYKPTVRSWPPAPQIRPFRVRRLDTLYATDRSVGLIVLNCSAGALSVLRGAERVLRDHCPNLVLDLSAVPIAARVETLEACVEMLGPEYDWFDGLLLPCPDATRRVEAILGLASLVACAIPSGRRQTYPQLPRGVDFPTSLLPLAALAWSDWQGVLPPDADRFGSIALAWFIHQR